MDIEQHPNVELQNLSGDNIIMKCVINKEN